MYVMSITMREDDEISTGIRKMNVHEIYPDTCPYRRNEDQTQVCKASKPSIQEVPSVLDFVSKAHDIIARKGKKTHQHQASLA
jgi:hypothetical protein